VPSLQKRIDTDIANANGNAFRRRIAAASGPSFAVVKTPLIVAAQLLGLWALNVAGVWLVRALRLPIPGNLVGLVALYLLLSAGVVKVSWFDPLGSWLIKHLAFFFIPITVGLMDAAGFLLSHVVAITVALVASAAAGTLLAGLISQMLIDKTLRARGGT
jgi:holin-like protein